ncbi:CbtA family protein [Sphaerisporangium sp. NPDC005289]|uniref:CbtA family protein n=1 Tax=Sphaerisporangium sp. NPDC005289 TaxID=3155247 RepID=UPI0033A8378B
MVKNLLVRGMLAGLVAAALALVFAWIFGEPQVGAAVALEGHAHAGQAGHALAPAAGALPAPDLAPHAHADAAGDTDHGEPFSRAVQSTVGLATAVGVYGLAVGGVFALVFAFAYGRLGAFTPRVTAGLLAAAGFVAVELVPFLKYPANPPAVGDPATIGRRTALYFVFVLIAVLLAVAAVSLGRRLAPRFGNGDATVLAVVAFLVAVTAAGLLMPGVEEVPADFPAVLLWRFRLASVGIQAVLWSGLGLAFGLLADRVLAPRRAPAL